MWHPKATFPDRLKTATSKERVDYFGKQFLLKHAVLNRCQTQIKRLLFKPDRYPIINIVGPTGAGKTALAKYILKHCLSEAKAEGLAHGFPAIYVEVPKFSGTRFDWKGFYLRILKQLQAPTQNIYRSIDAPKYPNSGAIFSNRNISEDEVRLKMEDYLRDAGVRVLIFDEVQHLFKYSAKSEDQYLALLKNIANTIKCQLVIIGTYSAISSMSWSGELTRRKKDVHLHRYKWNDKQSQIEFGSAISGILAHVPYQFKSTSFSPGAIELFYRHCCGCIGIFKQMVEEAIDELEVEAILTPELILAAAPTTRDLIQIGREIREGEIFFEEGDLDEVSRLLGMAPKNEESSKKKPIDKSSRKPGERKPVRDAVGV